MIDKVVAGACSFHDGRRKRPVISLQGCRSPRGMQIVRVGTARGWLVLGSDKAVFR